MAFLESFSITNIVVVGSKFFYALSYFVFLYVLQNNLSVDDFQIFAKFMSVVGFISLIAHFGQSRSLLHEFKGLRNDYEELGVSVNKSINLISFLIVATFPIALILNYSLNIHGFLISILTVVSVINYISQYFLNFLFSKLRMNIQFSLLIFFLAPFISITLILIRILKSDDQLDLYSTIFIFELSRTIINIFLFYFLTKKLELQKLNFFNLPNIIKSIYISISDILINSMKHLYVLIFSYFAFPEEIAFLYIALRFCELILLPAKAILNRYSPEMSELYYQNNSIGLNEKIFQQILLLFMSSVVLILILFFLLEFIFFAFSIDNKFIESFLFFIIAAAINSIFYHQDVLLILKKKYFVLISFLLIELILFLLACIFLYNIMGILALALTVFIFKTIKHVSLLIYFKSIISLKYE